MEKFMPTIGGLSYWHVDLEGGILGLYRQDGAHFSDVGLNILNLKLQCGIERAAVVCMMLKPSLWGHYICYIK